MAMTEDRYWNLLDSLDVLLTAAAVPFMERAPGHSIFMNRFLLLLTTAAVGATVFASRAELRRYLRMRRMGKDPSLVGVSVTPQGNRRARST